MTRKVNPMDIRYYYWLLVGLLAFESPNREFVAVILAAIYTISVLVELDLSGLSFGINCCGIWILLFPNFSYGVQVYILWIILISFNYLLVKFLWTRSER